MIWATFIPNAHFLRLFSLRRKQQPKNSPFRLHKRQWVVYTLANCGLKWVKVGHFGHKTLGKYARMEQLEQVF